LHQLSFSALFRLSDKGDLPKRGPRAMSDKPRRPWFQIHLSTAIVLMFVAGGIGSINLRVTRTERTESVFSSIVGEGHADDKFTYYGWPCDSFYELSTVEKDGTEYFYDSPIRRWMPKGIIVNIFAAMISLIAVWYACEWLLRRREARAP
jgi:hypothetical protein